MKNKTAYILALSALLSGCGKEIEKTSNLEQNVQEVAFHESIFFNQGNSSIRYDSVDWDKKVVQFKKLSVKGFEDFGVAFTSDKFYLQLSVSDPKTDAKAYLTVDSTAKTTSWSSEKKQGIEYKIIE